MNVWRTHTRSSRLVSAMVLAGVLGGSFWLACRWFCDSASTSRERTSSCLHQRTVTDIAITADDAHVVTASVDGFVKTLNRSTMRQVDRWDTGAIPRLLCHDSSGGLCCLIWTPEELSFDLVRRTGERVVRVPGSRLNCQGFPNQDVALAKNGSLVAVAGRVDGVVVGQEVSGKWHVQVLENSRNPETVAVSGDGALLFAISLDGIGTLWDGSNRPPRVVREWHVGDGVTSAAVASTESGVLAIGRSDGQVEVFNARTGSRNWIMHTGATVVAIDFSEGGSYIVMGSGIPGASEVTIRVRSVDGTRDIWSSTVNSFRVSALRLFADRDCLAIGYLEPRRYCGSVMLIDLRGKLSGE